MDKAKIKALNKALQGTMIDKTSYVTNYCNAECEQCKKLMLNNGNCMGKKGVSMCLIK